MKGLKEEILQLKKEKNSLLKDNKNLTKINDGLLEENEKLANIGADLYKKYKKVCSQIATMLNEKRWGKKVAVKKKK